MKKVLILALSAFLGVCVVKSVLATQEALKEKEAREKDAAEAAK